MGSLKAQPRVPCRVV